MMTDTQRRDVKVEAYIRWHQFGFTKVTRTRKYLLGLCRVFYFAYPNVICPAPRNVEE